MSKHDLDALREGLKAGKLTEEERALVAEVLSGYFWLTQEIKRKSTTISRLRRLFGVTSERAADLGLAPPPAEEEGTLTLDRPDDPASGPEADRQKDDHDATDDDDDQDGGGGLPTKGDQGEDGAEKKPNSKRPGHGRLGAAGRPGADTKRIAHPELVRGSCCPDCERGRLYALSPGKILRITGCAPLEATVYEPDRLRCSSCGSVQTAPLPEGIGTEVADTAAKAIVSVLHYAHGMPFHRLARFQEALGMPVPESTQWEMVEAVARVAMKVWTRLKLLASTASLIHHDDTTGRVAELRSKIAAGLESIDSAVADASDDEVLDFDPKRRGIFTTGMMAHVDGREIYLYFTGRRHAGENLQAILEGRPKDLSPPIVACDALSRNIPKGLRAIISKCLTHGRRNFVDCLASFPAECGHVIAELAKVYRHDAVARRFNFTPAERLSFHRDQSGPVMTALRHWMKAVLASGEVEENGGLGKAILYMLNHWHGLTAFLRVPGAPLTNDIVERALKWSIVYRKNSLQYLTVNGALVGDILMSVIRTCTAAAQNPVKYLKALLDNSAAVRDAPDQWLPWNYCQAIPSG
jgi:hypothetical protein